MTLVLKRRHELLFFLLHLLFFGQLALVGLAKRLGFFSLPATTFELAEHLSLAALVGIPAEIIFLPAFQSASRSEAGRDAINWSSVGLYCYRLQVRATHKIISGLGPSSRSRPA
ncbi:MAG: hypothetical protein U5K69_13150 [Balneolaceae bacterium]|nr:hypothetical protein [Balneolaceae bacterium]